MTDKEKILKVIEQKRQVIYPTDTGEMAPSSVPNDLEQGWLNALKWMENLINSLPAEQPSKDLEKETESYLITNRQYAGGDEEDLWGDDCIRDAVKHGAQWQKEQLMKSAVDATVSGGGCHISLVPEKDISQICKGDRVKIIVVKEDELPVGNKDTNVRFPSFEESQGETVYDSYNIVLNG